MKHLRLLALVIFLPFAAGADCTLTNLGMTALPDLGLQTYKNFPGGLYDAGTGNERNEHFYADGWLWAIRL